MTDLKNTDRWLKFWLLVLLFVIGLTGCCSKKKSPHYYVSDYGKSWVEYAGTTVKFKSDSGDLITFSYSDAKFDQFEGSYGEECGTYYVYEGTAFSLTSLNNSLAFDFSLTSDTHDYGENLGVMTDGQSICAILFQNDTFSNYIFSSVMFIDQLVINGKTFQNVFHADLSQNSFSALSDSYLSKEGIVGFKTKDGKTWVLQ